MPLISVGAAQAQGVAFYGTANLPAAIAAKFQSAFAGKITSIVVSGVKKCVSITITTTEKTFYFKNYGQLVKYSNTVKVIFTPKPLPITPAVPMPIVPAAGLSLTSALLIAGGVLIVSACLYFGVRYAINAMRAKEQNAEQQPPPPSLPPLLPLPLPSTDSSSETPKLASVVGNDEPKVKPAIESSAPKLVAVSTEVSGSETQVQAPQCNSEQKFLSSLNKVVKLMESRELKTELTKPEEILFKKFKGYLKVKKFESGMLDPIMSWLKQSIFEKERSYEEKLLLALKDVTLASNALQNERADNNWTLTEKEQELTTASGPLLSKLILCVSNQRQPPKLSTTLKLVTKMAFQ